jgi:hypothetical protein
VATNATNIQYITPTNTIFTACGGTARTRPTGTGFAGVNRGSGSEISTYISGRIVTQASASGVPGPKNFFVFDRAPANLASNSRLGFYSIGTSLDLAALDTAVSNLIEDIGNAL